MKSPMRRRFTRKKMLRGSVVKLNGWFEKGQKPRQIVEARNWSGQMVMEGATLSMIHGSQVRGQQRRKARRQSRAESFGRTERRNKRQKYRQQPGKKAERTKMTQEEI